MAEGPLPTLSQILAKGNGTQSSVRVRLEELREMDRPSVRVTGAAARPSVRVTGAAPASQKQLDLLPEPYTCITPRMMQGTARDVGVVHVPDEALRLAVHMNKQHRRTREEQARQRRENANCVILRPKQED